MLACQPRKEGGGQRIRFDSLFCRADRVSDRIHIITVYIDCAANNNMILRSFSLFCTSALFFFSNNGGADASFSSGTKSVGSTAAARSSWQLSSHHRHQHHQRRIRRTSNRSSGVGPRTVERRSRGYLLLSATTVGGVGDVEVDVTSLLDGDQEAATVARAKVEEEILTTNGQPRDELVAASEPERREAVRWMKKQLKLEQKERRFDGSNSKKKKTGSGFGGGGGGGAASGKKKKTSDTDTSAAVDNDEKPVVRYTYDPTRDASGYGAVLQRDGVVRIDSVLSKGLASELFDYIDEEKARSERDVAEGRARQLDRFTRVLLKSNRCDLLLPFGVGDDDDGEGERPLIMRAVDELLCEGSPMSDVIESTVGGPDAELYEFSCLVSDPGSDRQVIHPDIAHQGKEQQKRTGPLVTCFVALQDIDATMGPSEFLPGTNTAEAHELLNNPETRDAMLAERPTKLGLLKQGDCSIFDATTLHAGLANRSADKRRCLFYFTFRYPLMEDPRTDNNPGSIRPEVKDAKWTLRTMREHVRRWEKNHHHHQAGQS